MVCSLEAASPSLTRPLTTTLRQVGALSRGREALTPLGAVLSLLPLDASIGKLLVLGALCHVADPALTMAAALSVQVRTPASWVRLHGCVIQCASARPFACASQGLPKPVVWLV